MTLHQRPSLDGGGYCFFGCLGLVCGALLIALLALVSGCGEPALGSRTGIRIVEYPERRVTCFIYNLSISCVRSEP